MQCIVWDGDEPNKQGNAEWDTGTGRRINPTPKKETKPVRNRLAILDIPAEEELAN